MLLGKIYFLQLFGVFFFQAEDGIRDADVTGVQTCALPISSLACVPSLTTIWQRPQIPRPPQTESRSTPSARAASSTLVPAANAPRLPEGVKTARTSARPPAPAPDGWLTAPAPSLGGGPPGRHAGGRRPPRPAPQGARRPRDSGRSRSCSRGRGRAARPRRRPPAGCPR